MARDDPITYKELSAEYKQRYDEIKAQFEADLISSFADDGSDAIVHGCSCGRSAWFWPSVAKVRTTQDRGYLENAIGDLKARLHFEKYQHT
jgi:hypothetical protein